MYATRSFQSPFLSTNKEYPNGLQPAYEQPKALELYPSQGAACTTGRLPTWTTFRLVNLLEADRR